MADTTTVDWTAINQTLNQYYVPEIFLVITGIVAMVIVYFYLKDKDGPRYHMMELIGVLTGIAMVALCVSSTLGASTATTVIVAVACFALIIRPFRDVQFAAVLSVLGMVIAYIMLGNLNGELSALAVGWPRVILAFAIGAIIYMLLGYLEALVQMFGKFLNAWPILFILGIICIAESICVTCGYGSIYTVFTKFYGGSASSGIMQILFL
jgi:hypothetical protein